MNCCRKTNAILSALLFWTACTPGVQQHSGHFVRLAEAAEMVINEDTPTLLCIRFQVEKGYHILGNAGLESNFYPTTLSISENAALKFGETEFSGTVPFEMEGLEARITVFEGTFEVRTELTPEAFILKGKYTLEGRLAYQACDGVKCFFPRELSFPIELSLP